MMRNERVGYSLEKQEVRYKDTYFPVSRIKRYIKENYSEGVLSKYIILSKFNQETGSVERKYAWPSIIMDLIDNGKIIPILDDILKQDS